MKFLRKAMTVITGGQAIREMSVTYAACGNIPPAEKWAGKADMIHHHFARAYRLALKSTEVSEHI